jgi:hypothetical protein
MVTSSGKIDGLERELLVVIKARAGNLIILGISEENVVRLKQGEPIKIDGHEMGLEGDILIFYAPTTGDLIKTIQPMIGKDTRVNDNLD